MNLQCRTCGATYVDVQADGTMYFHACPPLAAWELEAALDAGTVTLTKAQAAQLAALERAPVSPTAAIGAPTPAALYLGSLTIERPNKRDENVVVTGKDETGRSLVRATLEGAGVVELG